MPKDAPLITETVNEQIKKLEREKKAYGDQILYDSDYVQNQELWKNG